jgi:RNA polymerase sigma-70 factor, ECF subfamily
MQMTVTSQIEPSTATNQFRLGRGSVAPSTASGRQITAQDTNMCSLISAIASHQDKSAFAELYRHYAPRLKAYCQRQGMVSETAEELAQEAMVSVWRKAATFDPAKASVSTWLFTIVRNKRIDLLRRENRPELTAEDFEVFIEPERGVDETTALADSADHMGRALELLPPDQKTVIVKAFYEDKSHSEIAAETGLPLGTVKSRIRLALSRLKVGLPS